MDEIVKAAMVKWPNVPDCRGWLGLDARGQWWLRDAAAQAAGPFAGAGASMASKGTLVEHVKLKEFIARNYEHDESGQWFFQNGPQRVYVELERAPWVLRLSPDLQLQTHTGLAVEVLQVLTDEMGHGYAMTDRGLGVLHSQDMGQLADALDQGTWELGNCDSAELEQRYGFVLSPVSRFDLHQASAVT